MTSSIIDRHFITPIGKVVCKLTTGSDYIETVKTKQYENGKSVIYNSSGHRIELIEFKICQPLYNGETVMDSKGWAWRIEKIYNSNEKLKLSCVLTDYQRNVIFDTATGEHLDAIEASDDKWVLHIGTEDGEILNYRAELDDWFPKRLQSRVDFYQSITKMLTEGFETEIPDLLFGEQIYIHFLTAFDRRNQDSVNTWLAVDEYKRKLENWIGIW